MLTLLLALLLLLPQRHDLLLERLVLLLQALVVAGRLFHFLGADLALGLALRLTLSLALALAGHGLGLLLFAAAGGLGFVGLAFGGVFVCFGGSGGAGEGVSIAAVMEHWLVWVVGGSAHCLVGACWPLGPSLGGDFCDMVIDVCLLGTEAD